MLLTEISLHPFGWRLTSKIIRNPETRTRLKGKFVMSARGRGQVPEPSYKIWLFDLTRPLLLGSFRKSPQSPLRLRLSPSRSALIKCICHCSRLIRTFPFKEGATSPSASSPQERTLTGKPAVLYSQTSFNCVDFRLRSAEHSSELDASTLTL